jgi:K+-transporting ATPase KdpF subunit
MNALTLLTVRSSPLEMNLSTQYIIGAIIALFIFGYLLYTLINPEKF